MGGSRRDDNEKVCWLEEGYHLDDDPLVLSVAVPGGRVAVAVVFAREVDWSAIGHRIWYQRIWCQAVDLSARRKNLSCIA